MANGLASGSGNGQRESLVYLYKDESRESLEAEQDLRRAKVLFAAFFVEPMEVPEVRLPRLVAEEGTFDGLEDIRWFIHAYPAFREARQNAEEEKRRKTDYSKLFGY